VQEPDDLPVGPVQKSWWHVDRAQDGRGQGAVGAQWARAEKAKPKDATENFGCRLKKLKPWRARMFRIVQVSTVPRDPAGAMEC